MTHNILVVLIVGVLAGATAAGAAKDNVLERQDIDVTYSEFNKILADMEGAITTAESVLQDVKSMDIEDGRSATDTLFEQLKGKINGMLEGLAPNSVLMDNLEGAKANVIVLRRWFERQPSNYPKRDQIIMRLEETIQEYSGLTDQILAGRQEAQDALRELLRAKFYQSMEAMVASAEHSVDVTKRLVNSLQTLSSKIRQLAEKEMPQQTISN